MLGQTVSNYRILEKLGEGGMGVVYKAQDLKLHRQVALKFLPPFASEAAKLRFVQEARAISALNHPHIATIHDIEEADGRLFIVFEYLPGGSLKALIQDLQSNRKNLSAVQVLDYARQIAQALQHAHSRGVIHRDIKSDNILFTSEGELKITDFGLAKLVGEASLTKSDSIVGTTAYMSPEQLIGAELDHRTDIFSFGVVLYEMIAGLRPFQGEHDAAIMYAIVHEEPLEISKYRTDVPEGLVTLSRRCLQKDKMVRCQSMKEVLGLLVEKPPTARVASEFWARILKLKWIRVAFPTLVVLSLVAWFLLPRILAPPATGEKKWRVAILPFQDFTAQMENSEWPVLVQTLFVSQLTGVEELGVIDPLSLNGVIESTFGTLQPQRTPELYTRIKNMELSILIDGSLMRSKDGYRIQLNLTDPEKGEVSFSRDALFHEEGGLPLAVDNLTQQVLDFLQVKVFQSREYRDLRPWLSSRVQNITAVKSFLLASQYIYRRHPGAERHILQAIELDSTFVAPRVWLISGLVQRGRVPEAMEHQKYLLKLQPEASPFEQAMIDWAGAYIAKDLPAQGRFLQTALEYSPGNNILLQNLADVKYLMGDYEGAVRALLPAIKVKWHYPPLYTLAGKCYIKLGDYREARGILEAALSVTPVEPGVYGLLSGLELLRKDTVEAARYEKLYFNRAQEVGFSWARANAGLGICFLDAGIHAQAIASLKKAIDVDPNNPFYHDELAEAFYEAGDKDRAILEFSRAIQIDSSLSNVHLRLGEISEEVGRFKDALVHYQAFLRLDSTSFDAKVVEKRIKVLQR